MPQILLLYFWIDQQISVVLQRRLNEAFKDFTNDILKACDYEPSAGDIPVTVIFHLIKFVIHVRTHVEQKLLRFHVSQFLDPVYGKKDSTYTEFMAPGMILTLVFFFLE